MELAVTGDYKTMSKLADDLHMTATDEWTRLGSQASPIILLTGVCKHMAGRRTSKRKAEIYLAACRLAAPSHKRSIVVVQIG
jgi:hypothetical protein